jgi:hypothetical protein
MDRRGPQLNRLDSVPRRPHRLMVIIPLLVMLAVLALIYRYAGTRWPGNATEHGPVDISETDAAHSLGRSELVVLHNNAGATPAAGFHKPPPAASH